MTITVSETPRLANGAERKVWQALIDQLEPGDLVIPGKRVTDHLKDHEVDFLVAIEGAGIVCVEVKGGEVWHDGETWRQRRGRHDHKSNPVRQAREACYALRDFIEKDPLWTQERLRWDHVVVLPGVVRTACTPATTRSAHSRSTGDEALWAEAEPGGVSSASPFDAVVR